MLVFKTVSDLQKKYNSLRVEKLDNIQNSDFDFESHNFKMGEVHTTIKEEINSIVEWKLSLKEQIYLDNLKKRYNIKHHDTNYMM